MAEPEKLPWYRVDTQLFPVKAIYFFFLAAVGDLLPFIPVYMKQVGLTSTETGIIYGVMPFIAFFVRPLIGVLADKTQRHKYILMACALLTGIFYCLLLITPAKTSSHSATEVRTQIQCNPIDSFITDCFNTRNITETKTVPFPQCQQSLTEFANQLPANASNIPCQATCQMVIVPVEVTACFTDDVPPSSTERCVKEWKSIGSSDSFKFAIDDVLAVVKNIVNEGTLFTGEICKTYDLKHVTYENHNFWQFTCSAEAVFNCTLSCGENYHKTCLSVKTASFSKTFWIFIVIFLFGNIVFAPVLSLVDAVAYDILGEKRGRWGQQRLWGTVGFAIFAIASTFIMDFISKTKQNIDYSVSFYIFLVLTVISAVVTFFLKISEDIHTAQIFKNLKELFKHANVVIFMLVITCFGILNAVVEAFLFWFLQDLGSSQIVLGLCLVFNCVPEVLMFMFTGRIIKLIGHVPCLYIALVAFAVRFFCYSFLVNPWFVLLIEPLHCLTFALMYAGASSYASVIAPVGMSATLQGLVGGLYFGFGKGIGSLVTGKLFDPVSGLGQRWTFRFYGLFALFVLVTYVAVNFLCMRKAASLHVKSVTEQNSKDMDETHAVEEKLLDSNCVSNENTEL